MASRRLVFPWPLGPKTTVARGPGSISACAMLRKSRSLRRRRRTPSDSDRHHHCRVGIVPNGAENAGGELVGELEGHLLRVENAQDVHQVARVEADPKARSRAVDGDLLVGLAELGALARDLEHAVTELELDGVHLILGEERDTAERVEKAGAPQDEGLRVRR